MCNKWCNDFIALVSKHWPDDASILEVGSFNVNGSPRDVLQSHTGVYVGVDLQAGSCVDKVLDVSELSKEFGPEAFDVVISTESLEHVADWRLALVQMATVLKTGGWLAVTTCSPGFEYHPYPLDCWRYTWEQFQAIFVSPMESVYMEKNLLELRKGKYSGVAVLAKKIDNDIEAWAKHLSTIEVATP